MSYQNECMHVHVHTKTTESDTAGLSLRLEGVGNSPTNNYPSIIAFQRQSSFKQDPLLLFFLFRPSASIFQDNPKILVGKILLNTCTYVLVRTYTVIPTCMC